LKQYSVLAGIIQLGT